MKWWGNAISFFPGHSSLPWSSEWCLLFGSSSNNRCFAYWRTWFCLPGRLFFLFLSWLVLQNYSMVECDFSSRCGTFEVRCKFMRSLDMITQFAQFLLDLRYPFLSLILPLDILVRLILFNILFMWFSALRLIISLWSCITFVAHLLAWCLLHFCMIRPKCSICFCSGMFTTFFRREEKRCWDCKNLFLTNLVFWVFAGPTSCDWLPWHNYQVLGPQIW